VRGTVSEFDEDRCLGTIVTDSDAYAFHGVVLADGSRTIEPGTPVEFDLLPKFGRYEATNIRRT
jgi:cold shock CspA family protein